MHMKENNPLWRKTQENLNHPASFPGEEPGNGVFNILWFVKDRLLICQSFQDGENMKSWRSINLFPGRVLPGLHVQAPPERGTFFRLRWGHLSSTSSQFLYLTRELKQRRRPWQRERQKANRLRLTKWQLCTCITLFVHFFAVVTRLQRESA